MKKLIIIFLVLTSMFSFFVLYNIEEININNKIEKAEHELSYSYRIILPGTIGNKPQKEVYEILKKELNKYNGNIYFTRVEDKKTIKYIYITDNNYFSKIKLDSGRIFNKNELESEKYLSTQKEDNLNEIGIISSLGKNELFEIKPLKNMIKENHSLDGQCTISFNKNIDINKFFKDLTKSLDVKGIKLDDSQINIDVINISNKDMIIIGSLYLMVMLLVFYKILKDYKDIGIEKLVGYSNKSIYIKRISFILGIQAISFLITIPLMSFVLIKHINYYYYAFIFKYLKLYLLEAIILILLCSIPFLYLNKVKIMDVIKNKKPTNHIIIFNMFVKIGLIIVFIFILNNGLINFKRIRNVFTNSFTKWEEASKYVVIPSISGDVSYEFIESKEFKKIEKNLYKKFNSNGAILADFDPFLDSFRDMRISEGPIDYERDIVTVNPNYLKKYPVYDVNNKKINISENDKDYIILVPEKYKDKSEKIKKYYTEEKDTWGDFTKKEKLKIIWIKDNQKLFSMNIDVNKKQDNTVKDPLIRVLTEANGDLHSYDIVMGISGKPFKIKVNDVKNAKSEILPEFEKVGLGKGLEVVGVNDEVASEIKDVKEMVINLAVEIVILVIGMVLIISQSIYNFMEQYKQHIAIRKLNGYSFFSLYFEYFIITALSWLTEFVVVVVSHRVLIKNLILIMGIVVILELVIIISVLLLKGEKDIIKIIKGAE